MSFSYQYGSNPTIDYVRLLTGDTVDSGHIWEDAEIQAAYVIDTAWAIGPAAQGIPTSTGSVTSRRAAAVLLDSLAANKSRIAAAAKVLDIQINLKDAADALREQAQCYRDVEADSGYFAITEMVNDPFSARERVWKQNLRLNQ